jgi:hypothetical protein
MDAIDNTSKIHLKFFCSTCDFECCKKGDWKRHLVTVKHISLTTSKPKHAKEYVCKCGKIYKHGSSLSLHKKTCKNISLNLSDKELILMVINENKELKNIIMEMSKNVSNITNNTTNTNSNNNNKTFNLQIFLNEDCKDALNINDFVSSIKMDLNDLEKTGRLGYVTGVSNIINKNLSDLDQTMRPIHCSDAKREVFYVKSEDQWIKETDDNKPILTKAIKQIGRENIKQISEWQKKNPDCCDPDSKKNDMYLDIVSNAMSGGSSEEQMHNYEKIISNVAKEVIIEKI